jgi:hypothetical protein
MRERNMGSKIGKLELRVIEELTAIANEHVEDEEELKLDITYSPLPNDNYNVLMKLKYAREENVEITFRNGEIQSISGPSASINGPVKRILDKMYSKR